MASVSHIEKGPLVRRTLLTFSIIFYLKGSQAKHFRTSDPKFMHLLQNVKYHLAGIHMSKFNQTLLDVLITEFVHNTACNHNTV